MIENTYISRPEYETYQKKALPEVVSRRTMRMIYQSDSLEFREAVIGACFNAPADELLVALKNLDADAWEFGNILCSMKNKGFVASIRFQGTFTLMRNDESIAKLAVGEGVVRNDKQYTPRAWRVSLPQYVKPKTVCQKDIILISDIIFFEYKK